jgi:hypothetical protein
MHARRRKGGEKKNKKGEIIERERERERAH